MKLIYDRVVMGYVGDDDDDATATDDEPGEVVASLDEYENDCFIGPVTSPEWCESIMRGKSTLFDIFFDKNLVRC